MRERPRLFDTIPVDEQPKINMQVLKQAIVESTGEGKPWSRNKLSLAATGGRSRDLIRDIMRSKSGAPSLQSVAGIAAALDRPPDERYPVRFPEEDVEGQIYGLRAEGRSMDKVIPPGTDLQVLKLIGSNVVPQDGDYVIVERSQGPLREQTCKQLHIREDGNYELVGESYLPEFNEPLFFGKPDEAFVGDDEVRIVGIVLNAKKSLFQRRRSMPETA